MKAAYADPPYVGCGKRYPEKKEIDYLELVDKLYREYDCWALSCSSSSLQYLLSLCRDDVRIAAWVKPFCVFRPNVNPAYAWEPVIFHGARKRSRAVATVRDWVSANITIKKGLVGAKPPQFCFWLFELLGLLPEDEFCDLYPGTGMVSKCWRDYCFR
jgi:hypothetical protein